MVFLDSEKLMECVEWEQITKDTVTIKVNGEKLRQQVYNDLKYESITDPADDVPAVYSQDAPFIKIYPNTLFDEKSCNQIALELCNRLNSEVKTKLGLK